MEIISNIYFLIFLPLISSLFCQGFSKKNLSFFIALVATIFCFLLSLKVFFAILLHSKIQNDFYLSPISLALEFKIDILSAIFLPLLIFLKIAIICFYRFEIKKSLENSNQNIFYSVFLINIFSLIGILTTNNSLNLFLFLEIYAFSFFALSSVSKDQNLLKISFQYFCLNAIASILMLFCFLIIYLAFGELEFDKIAIYLDFISKKNPWFLMIIFLLLSTSLIIKFFPFWLFFNKIKSNSLIANFLITESIFIKVIIGLFLSIKFFNLFFIETSLFTVLKPVLLIISLVIIFYSLFKLQKQRHLKAIGAFLCLNNIGFIFASIAIANKNSFQALFFYILNFALINFFIFLFASFLKRHFFTSSIYKISLISKNNSLILLPLKSLIIFIAAAPFTILFFANWNLLIAALNEFQILEILLILAIFLSMMIYLNFALKIATILFANKDRVGEGEKLKNKKYYFYAISFYSLAILVLTLAILPQFTNGLSLRLASYFGY